MTPPNPESGPFDTERGADLQQLFDAALADLADEGFSRATMARLRRAQRQRRALLAIAWLLATASPVLLIGFDRLVSASTTLVDLVAATPAAWAIMVAGSLLLLPALWPEADGLRQGLR